MPIQSREREIHEKRLDSLLLQLPDYVQEYVLSKKRKEYSPSTLLGYVHEYIKFFTWLKTEGIVKVEHIKEIPYSSLESLRKDTIEFYIDHLKGEDIRTEKEKNMKSPPPVRTRSEQAVNRNINALKSLFNYLTEETENEDGECYFYRNVFSKIKLHKKQETASRRAKKISSVILNDDEITGFIDYLKHDYEQTLVGRKLNDYLKNKERDIAIISVLLGSGVRVSEIASITLSDIDFQKEQIDIIRKGNKEDTVDVLPSALEDLKAYLEIRKERYQATDDDIYVFVTRYGKTLRPISVRSIQNFVTKYTKAFNSNSYSTGKGISPHKLRHSFASDWIKNGGDIVLLRDQLGHNSIETTSKYTNLSAKEKKKVVMRMEEARKYNE